MMIENGERRPSRTTTTPQHDGLAEATGGDAPSGSFPCRARCRGGYQTFFALGRYPGGDGQFGHARWTSPASAEITNEPVVACTPWSAEPVRLGDPDMRVGDLNGDGLPDIVRFRSGQFFYWPGRGNGTWAPVTGWTAPREIWRKTGTSR